MSVIIPSVGAELHYWLVWKFATGSFATGSFAIKFLITPKSKNTKKLKY